MKAEPTHAQKLLRLERRNRTMVRLRERGWTLGRIANKYEITIQRVREIILRETGRSNGQESR